MPGDEPAGRGRHRRTAASATTKSMPSRPARRAPNRQHARPDELGGPCLRRRGGLRGNSRRERQRVQSGDQHHPQRQLLAPLARTRPTTRAPVSRWWARAAPSPSGLSLGESEISFAANIDDKFYGQLTATVESEDGAGPPRHRGGLHRHAPRCRMASACAWAASIPTSATSTATTRTPTTSSTGRCRTRPSSAAQYGDDGVQLRWVAPTGAVPRTRRRSFRGQTIPSGGAQHGGVGTQHPVRACRRRRRQRQRMAGRRVDAEDAHRRRRGRLQRRRHVYIADAHLEVGAAGQLQGRRHHPARRIPAR